MLIGSYDHNIDVKGRLFIPAKWREDLGETFIVTKGTAGNCLIGMSLPEWEKISSKLAALPLTNKAAQAVSRALNAGAIDVELDKQGRINISQKLRTFAKLEGQTTLIGMTNHIEIWNSELLEQMEIDEDYDAVLEKAAEFGI